jgi:hypothetical protein
MTSFALKDSKGHRTSGMEKDLIFPTLHRTTDDLCQGIILNGKDKGICLGRQICQCATVDHQSFMTSLEQGWHKIGGQATGADNNDFHFSSV